MALHEIINDHTILPYSSSSTVDSRDALEALDQDALNTNNVILIYERRSEPKSNFNSVWNREHLWPNSYGIDSVVPEFSDVFNLRPADASVNTARGNKYFDISDPADPNYHNPGHPEAPLTSTDTDSWEPPGEVKGDIARAMFYMDVRYEGDHNDELDLVLTDSVALINSSTNFMGRLSTLLLWHQNDPVAAAEQLRNDLVFDIYQGNRNPFVDHPEWVALIFTTNQSAPVITSQPQSLTVSAGGNAAFDVIASGTRPVTYQWRMNGTNIAGATASSYARSDVQFVDAGSYSVVVSNSAGSVTSSNATLTVIETPPVTIAQWNFNSNPPDGAVTTGANAPSIGAGTAALAGNATATFATGSPSDSASSGNDNSGWNTASYPTQGTANKTAGVRFNVSTVGQENIIVAWDQRVSATASKYVRLQYSTNGITFIDFPSSTAMSAVTTFESKTNSLAGFAGVSDNPSFAIRIVTEWESTATGTANANYVTTAGGSYGTSGTIRFDLVTVSGNEIHYPPTITTQPQSQVAVAGDSAAFGVVATGTEPMAYQWQFNGANLPGATNAMLTFTNLTTDQTGGYSVTIGNIAGSTNSSTAVLSVYDSAAAMFTSFSCSTNGSCQMDVAGVPGYDYVIQASTNLLNWISLQTNSSPFTFVDTHASQYPHRFYRAIYAP